MTLNYEFVALPKGVQKELTGNELKLFITLFDEWNMMKNENGWFFRSQKDLVEDTGLSLRTIQYLLHSLIEKGVIFASYNNDGVKIASYNKANEYKINLEKLIELSKKGAKITSKRVQNLHQEGCKNCVPTKNIKTKNKENNNNLSTLDMKDLEQKVNENDNFNFEVGNDAERNNSSTQVDEDLFNEIFGVGEQSQIAENTDNEIDFITSTIDKENNTSNAGSEDSIVQFSKENCPNPNTPQIAATPPLPQTSQNKATGSVEIRSMGNLPTNNVKTQQEAREEPKTANILQEWVKDYNKLMVQIENTDVEDAQFANLIETGVDLLERYPKTEGNYKRMLQDLRYWIASSKVDFKKTMKLSERWSKYYRNI